MVENLLITGTRKQQKDKMLGAVNQYFKQLNDSASYSKTKKQILEDVGLQFGYTDINSIRNNITRFRKVLFDTAHKHKEVVIVYANNPSLSNHYETIETKDLSIEYSLMVSHKYFSKGEIYDFGIVDKAVTIIGVKYLNEEINLTIQDIEALENIISKNLSNGNIDIIKNF